MTRRIRKPEIRGSYPASINSPARRALYDNLEKNEELALQVDTAIRDIKKDGWRDMKVKRIEVRNAIRSVLGEDDALVEAIYNIAEDRRNGY